MNRFGVAVLWFVLLFAWNLFTKTSPDPDGFAYRCLDAMSDMTTPVQLLLSAVAMVAIWKHVWKRKSLAERQQAKADSEALAPPDEPEAH
jgi:hypothetical protein